MIHAFFIFFIKFVIHSLNISFHSLVSASTLYLSPMLY